MIDLMGVVDAETVADLLWPNTFLQQFLFLTHITERFCKVLILRISANRPKSNLCGFVLFLAKKIGFDKERCFIATFS